MLEVKVKVRVWVLAILVSKSGGGTHRVEAHDGEAPCGGAGGGEVLVPSTRSPCSADAGSRATTAPSWSVTSKAGGWVRVKVRARIRGRIRARIRARIRDRVGNRV